MYVSRLRQLVVKRMPETGHGHHPGCPSYKPDPALSGLGELVGDAVRESDIGAIELSVDFPIPRLEIVEPFEWR